MTSSTPAFRLLKSIQLREEILFGKSYEDPIKTVNDRIDEIHTMVKPKAELGNFIEKISPEQRALIMKIAETDVASIRRLSRKSLKCIDRFKHALLLMILINRACIHRRKYFKVEKADTGTNLRRLREQAESEHPDPPLRSSLALDMELALTTEPEYRTENDLAKATWVLRATKAFNHLFPVEKEKELARVVAYEKYDANRIIAKQGRRPERFYYILTGKVQKVREYTLYSGKVTRIEGMINKGTTTDLEELEEQWLREHHLVTKGQVEVLILHRDDFMRLQNKLEGPPIDYLSTLQLFYEFPVEVFLTNTDAIELKYYGQDVMISEDTNRTPWIHVVKSGRVRVVRIQGVIDVQNESKFATQKTEELGYGRSFSHADAMLGSLFSQRKAKAERAGEKLTLPELTKRHKSIAQTDAKSVDSGKEKEPEIKETKPETVQPTVEGPTKPKHIRRKAKLIKTPIIAEPKTDDPKSGRGSRADIPLEHYAIEEEATHDVASESDRSSSNGTVMFPPINTVQSARSHGEKSTLSSQDFRPHGTFLTREKTIPESAINKRKKGKRHDNTPNLPKLRQAKLQLDILNAGDIFGLDAVARKFNSMYRDPFSQGLEHLDPPIASEPKGVSLVSDGAEVIRISKRFFLQHAQNNTMLRVDTMQREYMTAEEASNILYTKETWNQYKDILMKRTVESMFRRD